MHSRFIKLVRLSTLLALATLPGTLQTPQATTQRSLELAKSPFEVRLRKLHLVRPDLISYPIYFEVYC